MKQMVSIKKAAYAGLCVAGILTLFAVCKTPVDETTPPIFTIEITKTGNEGADSISAAPLSGKAGTVITISYTLSDEKVNNRLSFSGTGAAIAEEASAGDGVRQYTINKNDAVKGVITINAAFAHTDRQANAIAFAEDAVEKTYGDGDFTITIDDEGDGEGGITYKSGNTDVAMVDEDTGEVTIVSAGETLITATKAADTTYDEATTSYTLTVSKLQLTIGNPTVTKTKRYDGATVAAVTVVGALNNVVGSDTVTADVASAHYDSSDVGKNKTITVVYAIEGADANNYTAPENFITTDGEITNPYTINIILEDAETGDEASASPDSGMSGDKITISYTLANTLANNQLAFSGTTSAIASVTAAGPGTVEYTIREGDANADGHINIYAVFTHTNKQIDAIAFDDSENVIKTYGDPSFTRAITSGGAGSGAIAYSSSVPSVATVNENTGEVTIVSAGATTITAAKAADATYEEAKAFYDLEVKKLQLTMTNPNVTTTKTYNRTRTAAAVAGSINNQVSGDTVTVSVDSATYNSELVMGANLITVVYSEPAGASASNYIKPENYTIAGSITPFQLSVSGTAVTQSRQYDGTTVAAVTTAGTLGGRVGSDSVSLTANAAYDTAIVGTGKTISVVYSISGADSSNYTKPVDSTINNASITQRQLTISAPIVTTTKVYDGATTAAVSAGNLTNVVGGDTVAVQASASYNSPDVGTGKTITVVYSISGASSSNYIKPPNSTTTGSITAVPTNPEPNRQTIVDFEADTIGTTYEYAYGDGTPTVKVVSDPGNSGQKSLQITTVGGGGNNYHYNQAAVIPINLPYALQNYQSFSFRIRPVGSLGSQSVMVYAAKNTSTFVRWGFGNPVGNSNQFAANLVGQTASVDFSGSSYQNTWTSFTIPINNPGDAIKDLQGSIYIAIGIHCQNGADYMIDDLTFTLKDNFDPPPILPPPPPPVPPATGAVNSGNYRNLFKEWNKTDTEINAKVNNAWNKLFVNGTADEKIFVEVGSDMAYIHDVGNNDVRSEGMSYGMMMCVQMNDKTRFDKLWRWAYQYMYNLPTQAGSNGKNNRGYFSWQVSTSGNKIDAGVAPDGEAYFVTALLFAENRWGNGSGVLEYGKHARQVMYDMLRRQDKRADPNALDDYDWLPMMNQQYKMTVFTTEGSNHHTDPSYHLPAFYECMAIEIENGTQYHNVIWANQAEARADAQFWRDAANASRAFFPTTTHPTTGLGPDYSEFNGTPCGGNHADFLYDAWRIAMNIAVDYAWWADDPWQKTFADRIQSFFHSKGITSYGSNWTLSGTQLNTDHSPGLVACNAVASLAATHERAWDFIENFWDVGMTTGQWRYYDGCLYMMGMLHVTGNFKAYLSGSSGGTTSSSISPTTAVFDKRPAQQNDINVTMTLNGNTLTEIRNGGTVLTSGTTGNYTVSGNVVTLKKEYLATLPVGAATLTFNFSAGANRTITITVTDTTNSSITPVTATFDKRQDKQSDIVVTMTLNGNSLSNIQNGGTTLANGTNYTVSGNTVTLRSSYLATLPIGTTTLTFNFTGGAASTLAIEIKESPEGGGSGTEYTFDTDVTTSFGPSGSTSTATRTTYNGDNALEVAITRNNDVLILPFNLGATTLADYSGIVIVLRSVSGDSNYKQIHAEVLNNGAASFSALGSNTRIATGSGNMTEGSNWKESTIPMASLSSSSYPGNLTGEIDIAFGFPNATGTYQIKELRLVPKL